MQIFCINDFCKFGRVVIRDWMEGSFENLVRRISQWFDDLSIVHRDGKTTIEHHKFLSVLAASVRELKDIPSSFETSLWRSALLGHPIPIAVATQTLIRVRIDLIHAQAARHARLGLLRAFCIRNERTTSMSTELDNSISDPAYLCGRMMAVLSAIQEAALGDVGAGVVQKYYAAASATPALVLGRLHRTAQVAHLPAISKNESKKFLRNYFEDQLSDLWVRMHAAPPVTLTLEQQTLFAMGFYQQRAARFKGKEKEEDAKQSERTSPTQP